jgi:pterin-4a-carbinolamine dehydratase
MESRAKGAAIEHWDRVEDGQLEGRFRFPYLHEAICFADRVYDAALDRGLIPALFVSSSMVRVRLPDENRELASLISELAYS